MDAKEKQDATSASPNTRQEDSSSTATRRLLELGRRETLRAICGALIVVALGIGFGKIVGVDSAYDRAIQNYRLNQLPRQLEERLEKLRARNLPEERFNKEKERIQAALLNDAMKARPTLSANDRSRWATIRALVEKDSRVYRYVPVFNESQKKARVEELVLKQPQNDDNADPDRTFRYYPDEILINCSSDCPERFENEKIKGKRYVKKLVPYAIDKAWETPGWDSIDVVKHGLKDEVWNPANPSSGYLYSSKPPLLPTLMAGPYWVLYHVFGLSLKDDPFLTVRILLIFYNLIPLGIAFCCLARVIDLLGGSDWCKIFALSAALFGFFTLTFVATLNNHVPGFVAISIALWASCEIFCRGKKDWFHFFCAGFFGAFAVICELPAIVFAGLLCVLMLIKSPRRTLLISIPAGLVVAAAFLATNYIAHGSFAPAYAHKRDHMAMEHLRETCETPTKESNEASNEAANDVSLDGADLIFDASDWYYYVYYPAGRARTYSNAALSHWANRTGVDRGEPSVARYAFHSTIGLRGVFSLTPIWVLSLVGIVMWLFEKNRGVPVGCLDASETHKESFIADQDARVNYTKGLALMALVMTACFFIFFLTRDQGDRNYGGMSCCPRWFFPLAPLFLICLLPALEWIGRKKSRRLVAYALLFFSVASAFYPTWNPWISPWLYQMALDGGLIEPY